MNKIFFASLIAGAMLVSGNVLAADVSAIQAEIQEYEQSREEALAEIKKLQVKLEKANNAVNQHETKVQELQAKVDAKKAGQ